MAGRLYTLVLLVCLTTAALSAPPPNPDQVHTTPPPSNVEVEQPLYVEATPSYDFTLENISSTVEEIFAEAQLASPLGTHLDTR